MNFFQTVGLVILVVAVGGVTYVRLAPSNPAVWHVDPLTASSPGASGVLMLPDGGDQVSPVFGSDAPTLLAAIDRVARNWPRTEVLAGSVEEGLITYIARSRVFRFPDYISVRAVPLGDTQSQLAVFSRARFGKSDLGVNAERLKNWLITLKS